MIRAQVDHLVVAASSLEEGAAWCEATLHVTPGPGGVHALMGTHNRLLPIASPGFPRAYLEIIAIDPLAQPTKPAHHKRWFDMDDKTLQDRLAHDGPQLIHFVAAVPDLQAATTALAKLHLDRGQGVPAARETPQGLLEWKIALREDGQRLFYGGLPTLIEWGPVHPVDSLPDAGLRLQSLSFHHPRPGDVAAAYEAIGLERVSVSSGKPDLQAVIETPRGLVTLASQGI